MKIRTVFAFLIFSFLGLPISSLVAAPLGQEQISPTALGPYSQAQDAIRAGVSTYQIVLGSVWEFQVQETWLHNDWGWGIAQAFNVNGEIVPYQVIVVLVHSYGAKGWYAWVPRVTTTSDYNKILASFPDTLIDQNSKAYLHQIDSVARLPQQVSNFSGHKLPWPFDQSGTVTQKDGVEHINQIDFALPGDIYASKPGTVVFVKESSNDTSCRSLACWKTTNMVVIQHSPTEYSWYLHLSYDSVPVTVGDAVGFGTKIGLEGATGWTCNSNCSGPGYHLHYMAATGAPATWTNPSDPNDAPWPTGITAVDFGESSWAALAVGSTYKSQNQSGGDLPSIPANFRLTGITQSSFAMAWDDVSNETGYKIYKWTGSAYEYLALTSANATQFTDTSITCDLGQFYRVSAFNGIGESDRADWIGQPAYPCAPSAPNPSEGAISATTDISLTWHSGALSWKVHVWNGVGFDLHQTLSDCANLHLGSQSPGQYQWQVTAINGTGSTLGPLWRYSVRLPGNGYSLLLPLIMR